MNKRKRLERLGEAQNWRCAFCGCELHHDGPQVNNRATIEHLIPSAKMGLGHQYNLVVSCFQCNRRRKTRNAAYFALRTMRERMQRRRWDREHFRIQNQQYEEYLWTVLDSECRFS